MPRLRTENGKMRSMVNKVMSGGKKSITTAGMVI